jgi:hypothetical protein
MDLAINDTTGDLYLDETGDLAVVTGADAVVQDLRSRLRFFLGEWFLDQREGVPYFREVFGVKRPSPLALSSMFRRVVQETAGISQVVELSAVWDSAARHLAIEFAAVLEDGGIVTTRETGPFIVEI